VDVQSAGIGDRRKRAIVELPLQGRQVTDLIVMACAAVNNDTEVNPRYTRGGVWISVAGGLPIGVAYLLDGAAHSDAQSNMNLPMPFPDTLQEFRVATSGLSAQNGVHGGRVGGPIRGPQLVQSAFTDWCPMMTILRKGGLPEGNRLGTRVASGR
jgi:hypothetical protein